MKDEVIIRRFERVETEFAQLKQLIQGLGENDDAVTIENLQKENQFLRNKIRQLELELWMTKHK